MTDKILIAYATRTGSTAEVADAIARRLCAADLSAEARPVGEVTSLDGYSAAILGSAVRYGSWLSEMTDFVSVHHDALSEMPVAFFTMHMLARRRRSCRCARAREIHRQGARLGCTGR